jgi:hypothetical protein
MGYCFELYTPDFKEIDSGKFVECNKLFFSNELDKYFSDLIWIGNYETTIHGKSIELYGSLICLDEEMCYRADGYTSSTFFTDFLKENECSGMLIRVT